MVTLICFTQRMRLSFYFLISLTWCPICRHKIRFIYTISTFSTSWFLNTIPSGQWNETTNNTRYCTKFYSHIGCLCVCFDVHQRKKMECSNSNGRKKKDWFVKTYRATNWIKDRCGIDCEWHEKNWMCNEKGKMTTEKP